MLTSEKIKKCIEASEAKAAELGIAVTTVIVDAGGSILAVSRMDNALVISPKFAFAKAYTAATLRMATDAIAPYAVEGKPYFGINTLFGGELTTMAGGLPIRISNHIVGGIGVGGSADTNQDLLCAQEALNVLQS